MPGPTEIILIVAVILVLFGASAIPKFARSIGKAKSEFKKGIDEAETDTEKDKKEVKTEKKEDA